MNRAAISIARRLRAPGPSAIVASAAVAVGAGPRCAGAAAAPKREN